MKIRHMKWADHYIAGSICVLLAIVHVLTPRFRAPSRLGVRRILVTKYFGIGSIVLLTPLFRAARRKYPSASITFVTFNENRRLAELFGFADEIYTLRTDRIWFFARDLLGLLTKLFRDRCDIAIDVEFFSSFSAIIAYLSGAPIRAGYYSPGMWRGMLLTERVYYNHYRHIAEVFLALARAVGAEETETQPLRLEPPQHGNATSLGSSRSRPYVVVNVNASDMCLERRWPAESFVALSDRLSETFTEIDLVFIGDSSERGYVEEIVSRLASKRVNNLAGCTTFEQLLFILSRATLVVSNDSGPLHLASVLGAPTVALFGPETPLLYGPQSSTNITLYKGIYCSPCLNMYNSKVAPCRGDNQCMKLITVEEVFDSAMRSLARNAVSP